MRQLTLALLLIVGLPYLAQAQTVNVLPDCLLAFRLTAIGSSNTFDNRGAGCVDWTVTYSSFGGGPTTFAVWDAPNATNGRGAVEQFSGTIFAGVTQPVTIASAQTYSMTGYFPFMGTEMLTQTGSSTIEGTLYGYRHNSPVATTTGASTVRITPAATALV